MPMTLEIYILMKFVWTFSSKMKHGSYLPKIHSEIAQLLQVSPCMEQAVLDQLTVYFRTRLAGYCTSISEDELMVRLY